MTSVSKSFKNIIEEFEDLSLVVLHILRFLPTKAKDKSVDATKRDQHSKFDLICVYANGVSRKSRKLSVSTKTELTPSSFFC